MKKWFAYIAIFLIFYLFFVIAILPVSFVMDKIDLPSNVKISGVSGTIWHADVKQISIDDIVIENANINVQLLSLITLNPTVAITFGDALSNAPEGSLLLSGLFGAVTAEDVAITVEADLIAQQLPMLVPIHAHDYVTLNMSSYKVGQPICEQAQGQLSWQKASVTAFDEKVKLGELKADIGCEQGALTVSIDPKNNLGLTFTAYLRDSQKVTGSGYLTPGQNFPQQIRQVLPFLGNQDSQGRYRLNF